MEEKKRRMRTKGLIGARTLRLLLIVSIAALIAAPAAIGAPAAVDQYVPQANPANPAGPAEGPAGGEAVPGEGGGSLPFTGYPLTPLVLVVLLLLVAGLTLRLVVWARERRQVTVRSE